MGEKRLRELLVLIQRVFTVSRQAEITVECNPDSVDWRSIARLRRAGVNRISLGAQTADPQQLRCLHRIHSTRQVVQAVADIRRAKITNLSLDLIYGLPDQDMASWLDTLNKAIALAPEHLSCYGLKVEEGTPLARQAELGLELPDGDDQADFYLAAVDRLRQAGYHQYEISNFSKPGKESRHNLKYWMGREYVGFGPGAHSYFDGQRYAYPRDLAGYLAAGGLVAPVDVQPIPPTERAREYLLLRMRTRWGIEEWEYRRNFGLNFEPIARKLEFSSATSGSSRPTTAGTSPPRATCSPTPSSWTCWTPSPIPSRSRSIGRPCWGSRTIPKSHNISFFKRPELTAQLWSFLMRSQYVVRSPCNQESGKSSLPSVTVFSHPSMPLTDSVIRRTTAPVLSLSQT